MIFDVNVEFFSTVLKKYTGQVRRKIWLARFNNIAIACLEQLYEEPIHSKIYREFKSLYFIRQAPGPHNKMCMHLVHNTCKITSSVAILHILPKIALVAL